MVGGGGTVQLVVNDEMGLVVNGALFVQRANAFVPSPAWTSAFQVLVTFVEWRTVPEADMTLTSLPL